MRILLVGAGAIGTALLERVDDMPDVTHVRVLDERADVAERAAGVTRKASVVTDFDAAARDADLVVEAASADAVRAFGTRALRAGADLVVVSVGALGDDALRAELEDAARASRRRVLVPSGAIGGLDLLRGAKEAGLERVTLTTAKPPKGLDEPVTARTVLFEGAAREAVKAFPRNVNVAAALALAGVGFDETTVRVVADPALTRNTHRVDVEGAFGRAVIEVANEPAPANPATSHLAALSVIALVRKLSQPLQVGS